MGTVKSQYLEIGRTIFYKFKLPEVHFALRVIWTCKKVYDAKLWLNKAIKMYFLFRKTLRTWQKSRYPRSRYRDLTVQVSYLI